MIKLIAIDLDGTLLDDNKQISPLNKETIKELVAKGIKIIIASGRPYFRIKPILKELALDNDQNYVIAYNGGSISLGDGSKIVYAKWLKNKDIKKIVSYLSKTKACFNLYSADEIYTETYCRYALYDFS